MHAQVARELPDGGQVLARPDAALRNGMPEPGGNLVLERPCVVQIDSNHALTVSDNDTDGKR